MYSPCSTSSDSSKTTPPWTTGRPGLVDARAGPAGSTEGTAELNRPTYYSYESRSYPGEVARHISAAARELGAVADPSAVQVVEVAVQALVISDVQPF